MSLKTITAKVGYESNQFQISNISRIFRCLILLASLASTAFAGWNQQQKIASTPRGVGAQFGNAVAVNGSTMVVGARFDATTASQAGAAYVFVLSGSAWTQQAVLLAPDGAAADKFGQSVAIDGDTIVVGAYQDDTGFADGGSAYVYVRSGTSWSFQQKLTPAIMAANDEFGNAVGVTGDSIIVGAHFTDLPSNSDAGSAYVFHRTGTVWSEIQKLTPTAPVILGDNFGESIAMSGGRAAIGASGDDTPETAAGAVYVFSQGGSGFYGPEQKLTIPNGTNGDRFGSSVAIEGTTLVGGAREDSPVVGQTALGAAYVFSFNGTSWFSEGKLSASDGAQFDRFGWSVAVSNNVIAVGAREDDTTAGPDAGSAYIFTRTGGLWGERQKIAPTDTFNGDRFGSSVALSSGNLVVGAAEKALSSPNGQGAAYYFRAPIAPTRFDFDGDGKADISIFRPSNGQWWYQRSQDNIVGAVQFGAPPSDKPVPADYDGDGKTDIAVWRPSTGEWFILRSSNLSYFSVPFGVSNDKPAPADYDGDGLADVCVFRDTEGVWYINKTSGGIQITQWGAPEDVPETGDYDGDGKADLAIYRPSNGQWWLNRSTAGIVATTFGVNTDKPVPADYSGDGKTDIAIWRPGNGSWYILRSEDASYFAIPFGTSGDLPAAADYDGDGKADFAVFRPSQTIWYINLVTTGVLIQQFGLSGDIPAASAFVP